MNSYSEFIKSFNDNINESDKYLFIIEKCCGYSFPIIVSKYITMQMFHEIIRLEIKSASPVSLSTSIDDLKNNIFLPNTKGNLYTTMYNYINDAKIKPLYPLPDPVVYKLYINLCNSC